MSVRRASAEAGPLTRITATPHLPRPELSANTVDMERRGTARRAATSRPNMPDAITASCGLQHTCSDGASEASVSIDVPLGADLLTTKNI